MLNAKIIMLIHNQKEEIKAKQRVLLIKYGFGKNARDIRKQTYEAFSKMFEAKDENNDYDTYINLEKDYVECNFKLVEIGHSCKETNESRSNCSLMWFYI